MLSAILLLLGGFYVGLVVATFFHIMDFNRLGRNIWDAPFGWQMRNTFIEEFGCNLSNPGANFGEKTIDCALICLAPILFPIVFIWIVAGEKISKFRMKGNGKIYKRP